MAMPSTHTGFEPWGSTPAGFPYPVGPITLHYAN